MCFRYQFSWLPRIAFCFSMLAAAPSSAHAVTVSSWELATILGAPGDGNSVSHGFTMVQNPFINSHNAMRTPASFAQAAYNFIWTELNASFQTTLSQQAHDVPNHSSLWCRTSAFIFVQPSVDSVLSVQGSYSYQLPPDSYHARFTVIVRDMNTNISIWSDNHVVNSYGGNPVSGVFNVFNIGIPLIGGRTYLLHYDYLLDSDGGGTNNVGTGVGGIQWSINAVPEAAALAPLACAIPILIRRRRDTGGHR